MKESNQGFAGIRQHPVGSVCVVKKDRVENGARIGLECTILGLEKRLFEGCYQDLYLVEFQTGVKVYAQHDALKLKKFPPNTDAWLREKMNDLLNNVPDNILKEGV
jgi:hypothetical protein